MPTAPLRSRSTPFPSTAMGSSRSRRQSRDSTPAEQFWIWFGANLAPINWVLGGLGIALGLTLLETVVVVAVGNVLGCALFGLFNVIGHRTAVNQMVLGRAPFGRRGSVVPGVIQCLLTMAWVGVNTWVVLDLALAVLGELGVEGGMGLRYVVAAAIMIAQLGLALYGFYAIRTFEKYTVPATAVVMVVMTAVAVSQVGIDWTTGAATSTADKVTAVTQLLTAIGVGWGISWIPYSADYSRFVRTDASEKSVFWASAAGMYVPTVWLAVLGACLASAGNGGDPSALVIGTFGVLALPVLLLIMHGPVATNILNLYSCSLAALTIGVRAARWKVTLVAGLVASVVLAVFVNAEDFAHAFDLWMVSILVWISPWAAIVLADFFVIRSGRLDVHGPLPRRRATRRTDRSTRPVCRVSRWASSRDGAASTAWCRRCRDPSRGCSTTPTCPGSRAVSSRAASYLVLSGAHSPTPRRTRPDRAG